MYLTVKDESTVWISDFFYPSMKGGAELVDYAYIEALEQSGKSIMRFAADSVIIPFLEYYASRLFIISNFTKLPQVAEEWFANKKSKYIILEHDHKYCKHRNPFKHGEDLKCDCFPKDSLRHKFYKNAQCVICQTQYHKDIIDQNVECNSVPMGLSVYSNSEMEAVKKYLTTTEKKEIYGIFGSSYEHKNTSGAIQYAIQNKLRYKIITNLSFEEFVKQLSELKGFIFLPTLSESASRMIQECRFVGMAKENIITNPKLVGAVNEEWFKQEGIVDCEKLDKETKEKFIKLIVND